jgi:hypothetical protein
MSTDKLLSHLTRVKRTAPGKWSACCPAHEDRSPSLAVRELDDGRVLVHCFGGCSVESVLGAIGLDMTDLFPERVAAPGTGTAPQRLRLPASQAIEILERETMIVAVVGGDMVRKKDITETDHRRLIQAVSRVQFIAQETKR